ncbi:hypothetical protein ACPOL_6741 (plasmid) [Acidisarcina polymorpha]|uniref:Uncharacterized protein n=1 Tax=Acidisarcina polymorpha TaxID=2211140 RepID=A0A2Z5G9X1_9BACT|nr:hypothetical protein [Acidisarcina polymorpha]AXC15951.1 hypothetical protein ACPOL_6741 [Acidisarcina polymorpha]
MSQRIAYILVPGATPGKRIAYKPCTEAAAESVMLSSSPSD